MANQKKHEIDLNEFEKAVKYTTFGNLNYISIMPGTMVFDKRGKRRIGKNGRVFAITKSYLQREMERGSKAAGVKRIRIHDLRHSHISLLIQLGYSAVAIADRVGHESIDITYRYAHLFPTTQGEMAKSLNNLRKGEETHVS